MFNRPGNNGTCLQSTNENTQVKHTTKLISFKTQCNDSTVVDKLFKSIFKSWRFEKHASKSYLKITAINSIYFCFC